MEVGVEAVVTGPPAGRTVTGGTGFVGGTTGTGASDATDVVGPLPSGTANDSDCVEEIGRAHV